MHNEGFTLQKDIEFLRRLGIVSSSKLYSIFTKNIGNVFSPAIDTYHGFMKTLWNTYQSSGKGDRNLNGKVFEVLVACCLYRAHILPFYVQAKLDLVPDIVFDFIAYGKKDGPIVLSAKTSLRERYKQADLEGRSMRQVYKSSKSYLMTLDEGAAHSVNRKISDHKVPGIDQVILATSPKFDEFIGELCEIPMCIPEKREVITSREIVAL
ncbi:MAG: hypothetical protein OXF02_05990 [Simkaniaceae bacterium]|nr:hypothetical protein [Simkaniaceae bacterium]